MNPKPETVSTHKPAENGKPALTPVAAPVAATPTPVATAPKAPKPNRQILKHQRALYKLEMQSTARTLAHIAEAMVCTSDAKYKTCLAIFQGDVEAYRSRLDADLAMAEGT